MKFLLYCIVSCSDQQSVENFVGVDGRPVSLIVRNKIGAAVSTIEYVAERIPAISQILAYEKVNETFHHDHSIIPMRYGCLFDNEQQIARLLEERGNEYRLLLEEIGDNVEMGIRVLISGSARNENSRTPDLQAANCKPKGPSSGRDFLAALKVKHASGERVTQELAQLVKQCQVTFSGLFVKFKEEYPHRPARQQSEFQDIYSLYFLVPRDAVASFRIAFKGLCSGQVHKFLLSGPWPPYNFVLP
ncbi:GvpL/GvpF family gas vesicle protein [Desulforhopalus vacuolatus]|uniref:GvpL/GvpF family gas vesicle protein n=1 Tax=Desulforhopalus vacuolatus TaxID=40414 RepID=UPI0019645140|nr:GvpL/GvpF family gas vesicle protein [Desulforhopalus vacuolatus]MBM9520264.1 GvpL/GvpF family gas vesicle protein [Desulforhopalus vacuolatus]